MKTLRLSLLVFVVSGFMAANVFAACKLVGPFSEEGSAQGLCEDGYAVRGITCKGSYCDDKTLNCCNDNMPAIWPNSDSFSSEFSEEASGPPSRVGYAKILVGMRCSGSYCDNLTLLYQAVNASSIKQDYQWGNWFSDNNTFNCSDNGYAVGVACKGKYCDDLSLLCITWPE